MADYLDTGALSARLKALGYMPDAEDAEALAYCALQAEQSAKNECGLDLLTETMRFAVTDLAVALFLTACGEKVAAAWAAETGEDASPARVKTVQEGDTSVTYMTETEGGSTAAGRVSALENRLRKDALAALAPFRRLTW